MLRVLHIDTMKGWRGGERQAFYLANGLRDRGYYVGFACQPGSHLEARLQNSKIRVHPTLFRFEADFTASWRMAGLIRKHNYQILHMHDSHAHWLGGCAAIISGRPLRIVSRRVDFSIHRHGYGLSIIKYRHFADAFIAVSKAVRNALINDGVPAEMIRVVYSGVKIPAQDSTNRAELNRMLGTNGTTRIVGTVGSLVGHKGHQYFVDAAAEIARRRNDVRFVIIGEGKLRVELESRIRSKGLEGKFFLPGFQPSASKMLKAFDIFVMPSIQEGLGSSLIDAMAAGVPVVGTKAGGIPEVVIDTETGLLADPGNAQSLAHAIESMLDDQALAARSAINAKKRFANKFTVERMVEETVCVYKEMLSART